MFVTPSSKPAAPFKPSRPPRFSLSLRLLDRAAPPQVLTPRASHTNTAGAARPASQPRAVRHPAKEEKRLLPPAHRKEAAPHADPTWMAPTDEELAALEPGAREERFRIACGAYVDGAENCYKGEKVKHDLRLAARLRASGPCDVDAGDGDGWTALHWCVFLFSCSRSLRARDAPRRRAAAEGRTRVVTFLVVDAGADVDAADAVGCTPLWCASCMRARRRSFFSLFRRRHAPLCVDNGEYQAALLLLQSGADVASKGRPTGEMAMAPAHAARSQGKPAIADLVEREATLRAADPGRVAALKRGDLRGDAFRASLSAKPRSEARILPASMNPYR